MSSWIDWHAYNKPTQELTIRTSKGKTYSYYDVPPSVAEGMDKASSRGAYYHLHVHNKYDYMQNM